MSLKLKLNSVIQARPFLSSSCHPLRPYAPPGIAPLVLVGARGYSGSMKVTGLEAVGIAMSSDTTTPILPARVAALEAAHDFQVATSNAELTSALKSANYEQKAHIFLDSFGSEVGEQYSKDMKNNILRTLARAGHHETFENIRKKYFTDAKKELMIAGILGVDQPYHKEGKRIIRMLLENGPMSERAYFKAAGRNIGMWMLDGNVFKLDLATRMVSFQSTIMRECCRRQLALWV